MIIVAVVQSLSHVPLLRPHGLPPAGQAILSFTISQSLLKFMSTGSVMLSNLSHPLLPTSPPALNLSQHQDCTQLTLQLHFLPLDSWLLHPALTAPFLLLKCAKLILTPGSSTPALSSSWELCPQVPSWLSSSLPLCTFLPFTLLWVFPWPPCSTQGHCLPVSSFYLFFFSAFIVVWNPMHYLFTGISLIKKKPQHKKVDVCICTAESLHCPPKTITALFANLLHPNSK